MAKPTGFLEFPRQKESYQPIAKRLQHYREFVELLSTEQLSSQSARCMDCGVPFCHQGCPINNLIPDWNDLVYQNDWLHALERLHQTNNFPEFTGRVCPAPCEAACTLNINNDPVGIKSIELAIVEKGWEMGWIKAQKAPRATNQKVAIIGSGPAGLACAQQLARKGHQVTVFEKNQSIGGLLRYGIPDFKLEKQWIERRITQLKEEGITFKTSTFISDKPHNANEKHIFNTATQYISPNSLHAEFDAIVVATGAEISRDLTIPNRQLKGIHFAMEYLPQQNQHNAGEAPKPLINAKGKHVIVIGGGDTGSDCVGTANRQGALSVTQFELMPMPPEQENKLQAWPNWPLKLRTSTSHEEGCNRHWSIASQAFVDNGKGWVAGITAEALTWQLNPKTQQMEKQVIENSQKTFPADLVFLALGFTHPAATLMQSLGVNLNLQGQIHASTSDQISNHVKHDAPRLAYQTNIDHIFAAGDCRRGQSLVVWAINEGRQCAENVHQYLSQKNMLKSSTNMAIQP